MRTTGRPWPASTTRIRTPRAVTSRGTIAQRLAHLLARLAHTGKHNALAQHANPLQMLQFAALAKAANEGLAVDRSNRF